MQPCGPGPPSPAVQERGFEAALLQPLARIAGEGAERSEVAEGFTVLNVRFAPLGQLSLPGQTRPRDRWPVARGFVTRGDANSSRLFRCGEGRERCAFGLGHWLRPPAVFPFGEEAFEFG